MRIKVRGEKAKLNLWFPTSLITSQFVLRTIAKKVCEDNHITIEEEQLKTILKVLSVYLKKHKGFVLVDAQAANGESVKISL